MCCNILEATEQINLISNNETRIAIACESKYIFLVVLLGILKNAKSAVLINSKLNDENLKICLKEANVNLLITDKLDKKFNNFINTFNFIKRKKDTSNFNLLSVSNDYPKVTGDQEWGVFYSSGTTGIPKGIVRNHYSIVTELLGWMIELQLTTSTHFFIGRPIFYTGGLVLTLATLLAGGSICINKNVTWENYQNHLHKHIVNYSFFVPRQLMKYVDMVEKSEKTPRKSDCIIVMGDKITGDEKIRAKKLLFSNIIESWGNSEGLGTITKIDDLEICPDSIGRPFITDKMFILDETGKKLPPLKTGRLAGDIEAGFNYYCSRPDSTKNAIKKSLLISEDIGYVDKDGYYYIEGRYDSFISDGKSYMSLHKIEKEIVDNFGISDCIIIKLKEQKKIFEIGCAILTNKIENKNMILEDIKIDIEGIIKQFNNNINVLIKIKKFKSIPETASGKINRFELKRIFGE